MGKKFQISNFKFQIPKKATLFYWKFDIGSIGNSCLRQAGFTLIEIILTISIMSILSLFAASTYRDYNQNKIVDLASQEVRGVLELAKARAQSQVKPEIPICDDSPSPEPLYGYQVVFCPTSCATSQDYVLKVVCGNSSTTAQINSYTLPSNVVFATNQPQSVTFRVLTGNVEGITNIGLTGFTRSRVLSITSTGVTQIATAVLPTPTVTLTPTLTPPNTPTPTTPPSTPTPTTPPPVTLDTGSNKNSCSSCTSFSIPYTVPGANRLLVVGLTHSGSANPTTVQYNGVNMTPAGANGANSAWVNLYYLVNPSTGANNVAITFGSGQIAGATVASFSNVSMSSPVGTVKTANATAASIDSGSITTTSSDLVVATAGIFDTAVMTPTTGQASVNQINISRSNLLTTKPGVSGTITMGASWTSTKTSGIVAIPMRRAP